MKKIFCLIFLSCVLFACSSGSDKTETTKEMQTEATTKNVDVKIEDSKKIEDSRTCDITNYEIVKFGSYQYDKNLINPIDWLVVEKRNDGYILVSEYILDCYNFNDENKPITFDDSTLKVWLNTEFLNLAFNIDEAKKLTTISDDYKVGILSKKMAEKYFGKDGKDGTNKRLAARATEYAILMGLDVETDVDNRYYKYGSYFLSDNGNEPNKAMWVGRYGHIYEEGQSVKLQKGDGIRPIICVSEDLFSNDVKDAIENSINNRNEETTTLRETTVENDLHVTDEDSIIENEEIKGTESDNSIFEDADEENFENNGRDYSNISDKKYSSVTIEKGEGNVIDLANWTYGVTPCEWIYVKENTQIISNYKPNTSKNFSVKSNRSSGSMGCFLPVFKKTENYGEDYEGRFYCFDDYSKIEPTDMAFANSLSDLTYGDEKVIDLLKRRYDVKKETSNIYYINDTYINVIYVDELYEILESVE